MGKRKTKKFIDKNNAVTFELVHRSQKDPLVADEDAPQRILVPVKPANAKKSRKNAEPSTEKDNAEKSKFKVVFDDKYNYLNNLSDVHEIPTVYKKDDESSNEEDSNTAESKIVLPSSIFESNVEEKVGLLNKAAPIYGLQLNLDPDIVTALDGEFDFDDPDNELEDNFIELANENDSDKCGRLNHENIRDMEMLDKLYSAPSLHTFQSAETKSRFTEYSLSSNVIKRNDQLSILDNKFERMYAAYDDDEMGPLQDDEIEGYIEANSNIVLKCVENYEAEQKNKVTNIATLLQNHMRIMVEGDSNDEIEENRNCEKIIVDTRQRSNWDCESVLSTYSNIYNHPKLISGPKRNNINTQHGTPQSTAGHKEQSEDNTNHPCKIDRKVDSIINVTRSRNESAEEKKERKQAVKNYRKERRKERKATVEAYKHEKKEQEKILINQKKNIQGNHIL